MVAKFDSRSEKCIEKAPLLDKKEEMKRSEVKTQVYIIMAVLFGLLIGFAIAYVLFKNHHSKTGMYLHPLEFYLGLIHK